MRHCRLGLLICAVLAWTTTVVGQGASGSDPQATALLQQSLAALTGGAPVTDVTMTGTVTVTARPIPESGTITLVATASGQSQGVMDMPSGTHKSVRDYSSQPRIGNQTTPGGGSRADDPDDLLGPHPAWFYPAFVIASASSSNYANSYVGQETQDGATVNHVAIWPTMPSTSTPPTVSLGLSASLDSWPPHVGKHDLYLSASSALPVALILGARAHNPDGAPIELEGKPMYVPEEIRYSDYRLVQGRPVAFHIQVYVAEHVLFLDIQLSSVSFNTGAVITAKS